MKKLVALFVGALLLLALGAVVYVPVALAHAEITECTPPVDGTVETAPEKLTCKTSQGMKAEGSSLQVFDAEGMQVDKGDSAVDLEDADRTTIWVSLDTAKMKDGVYTVKWTTVSADDGDEASGEFKFTVGHAMETSETPTAEAEHEHSEITHPNDDHSIGVATVDGKEVTLKILAPLSGATLPAGDVKIEASVEGVELGQDGYHLHFYLDDKLLGMGEGAQNTYTANLEPGKHELMVALGDHEHQELNNAHVHVTVEAAAQAPATSTEGTAPTLPATGGQMDYSLYGFIALFGMMVLGAGAFMFARTRG